MDLTIDHLTCRRAGRTVFKDISFDLPAGVAAALRGPNGVGKSTMLRQLSGFLAVEAGDARLGDISLASDRTGFQENIAYSGHLDAVKPALTVAENLTLWARLNGASPDATRLALERFGLEQIAGHPAAQCSAGQRRRLGLARLLVMNRALWLLDEPTVSLDAEATATIADLIRGHIATGGLALIATHVDLGLGQIPELHLANEQAENTSTPDPFLDGEWR